jgi:hypothetical protein
MMNMPNVQKSMPAASSAMLALMSWSWPWRDVERQLAGLPWRASAYAWHGSRMQEKQCGVWRSDNYTSTAVPFSRIFYSVTEEPRTRNRIINLLHQDLSAGKRLRATLQLPLLRRFPELDILPFVAVLPAPWPRTI